MVTKSGATKKKAATPSQRQFKEIEADVVRLREREAILLGKLDRVQNRLDWAFRHPIYFALGRIYHQNIKRDQKNAKD